MDNMRKMYIVGPKNNGDGVYYLILDNGEALASHYCSNIGFAFGDLEANRPERQEEWKKLYGEYKVLAIGDDDMTIDELIKLNHNNPKNIEPKEQEA